MVTRSMRGGGRGSSEKLFGFGTFVRRLIVLGLIRIYFLILVWSRLLKIANT